VPDPRLEGVLELARRLVVAVHVDPGRVVPAGEREVQLAAARHVDREPLLGEQPEARDARERLAREDHLEALGVGAEGVEVRAGARAHVVLGVDVRGRAELAGELDDVAAADLEPALLVQARAQGEDVRNRDHCHRRRL
jgi:hypothetical protein